MNQTKRRSVSIRQVLGSLLLAVIIPTLLLAGVALQHWYVTQIREEENANLELARMVSLNLHDHLEGIANQERMLGNAMHHLPPGDLSQANAVMVHARESWPDVVAVHWVAPDGRIIASSFDGAVGYSYAHDPGWDGTKTMGEWSVTNLRAGPIVKKPVVGVVTKIQHDGRLAGYVIAAVSPAGWGSFLGAHRTQGGSITIFDSTGAPVYRSTDPHVTGTPETKFDPLLVKALAGKESQGTIVWPSDRQKRIAARAPIIDVGWAAGASVPVAIAVKPVLHTSVAFGAFFLLLLGAALALSALSVRRIYRDVNGLHAHAAALARGDFDHHATVTGISELADLADSYNLMALARKSAEAAQEESRAQLAETSRRLRTMLDITPLAVVEWDADFVITGWSGEAEDIFGYSADEVVGRRIDSLDWIHPDDVHLVEVRSRDVQRDVPEAVDE